MSIPTFSTDKEIAEFTGLPREYVRELCNKGVLTWYRIGRQRIMNTRAAIRAIIAARMTDDR
jgi:excisionase family DNA binding protein